MLEQCKAPNCVRQVAMLGILPALLAEETALGCVLSSFTGYCFHDGEASVFLGRSEKVLLENVLNNKAG